MDYQELVGQNIVSGSGTIQQLAGTHASYLTGDFAINQQGAAGVRLRRPQALFSIPISAQNATINTLTSSSATSDQVVANTIARAPLTQTRIVRAGTEAHPLELELQGSSVHVATGLRVDGSSQLASLTSTGATINNAWISGDLTVNTINGEPYPPAPAPGSTNLKVAGWLQAKGEGRPDPPAGVAFEACGANAIEPAFRVYHQPKEGFKLATFGHDSNARDTLSITQTGLLLDTDAAFKPGDDIKKVDLKVKVADHRKGELTQNNFPIPLLNAVEGEYTVPAYPFEIGKEAVWFFLPLGEYPCSGPNYVWNIIYDLKFVSLQEYVMTVAIIESYTDDTSVYPFYN